MEAIYEIVRLELSRKSEKIQDRLDALRLALEPYIYNYIIGRYMPYLNNFWKTYTPPKEANNAFVLVERRPHPNFEFILKNIAWADPKNSVYIFCSDLNLPFILAILGDKAPHYTIIPVFKGDVSREQGKMEYNILLTQAHFYKLIKAEYIITVQMDNFFRRKLPLEIYTGDYWGNPWIWKRELPGGGGATVRRVAKMIELCETFTYGSENDAEDSWISYRMMDMKGEFPPFEKRKDWIMESCFSVNPYILHQFWTFIEQYITLPKEHLLLYLSHLLQLQIE